MTATLARPRVHGEVVRRLALAILEGDWAPGERLPNEAELGGRFGVSRTSLREAVRFLSAKGLIEARPRLGMAVRERDAWNLLDPDLLAWQAERGDPDPQLVASLVEARRVIEPAAAALAAERATAADLARIEAAYLAMARSLPADLDACCAADLDFHAEILRATHNLVFRQLIGTMGAALGATMRALDPALSGLRGHPPRAPRRAGSDPPPRPAGGRGADAGAARPRPARPGTRDRAGAVTVAPVRMVPLRWLTSSTRSRRASPTPPPGRCRSTSRPVPASTGRSAARADLSDGRTGC